MEANITNQLEDLKEIAIGKIKAAYNNSIDIEATHSVLWNITEKMRNLLLKLILILSFILLITVYIPVLFGNIYFILTTSIASGFMVLGIVGLTFYSIFQAVHSKNHKLILEDTLALRRQANDFQQYKLENLDKEGYIDEIKSLEINDINLKEKSQIYTQNLSKAIISQITCKVNDLEKSGFKKHVISQQEIDSANEKLQKFTALRTSEVWIKFE
jgi:hypothetical protein